MKSYPFFLFLLLFATACEEEIELDLNTTEPQLVVEAEVRNQLGQSYVRLSQTADFYDNNEFNIIEGASITIQEAGGTMWVLEEKESGLYENDDLLGFPGRQYELTIETNGNTYKATSTMPTFITIDSLSAVFSDANAFNDEGFQIDCHFQDPLDEQNFYRWQLYENDTLVDGVYTWSDEFFNGNDARYPFLRERFDAGDVITVEMFSVDAASYEYLLGLEQLAGEGPGGGAAAPGNPTTNISGGAVGYFGAFGYDIITEEITN